MSTPFANKEEVEALVKKIAKIMEEFEGQRLIVLDVQGLSPITDYMVIADFAASTQMEGAYEEINKLIKEEDFFIPKQRNMSKDPDWMILDAGPVVCHLMNVGARGFYNLEKLWENGKVLTDLS